jgi:hypothetical protein
MNPCKHCIRNAKKFLLMQAIFSVYNISGCTLHFSTWFYQVSGVWNRIFNERVLHFCSLLSGHIYALFFKGISCFYFLYCTRAKYLHCEEFLVMFSFLQDFKGTVSKDWEFVSEGLKIDSLLLECAQMFCYNFISFLTAGSLLLTSSTCKNIFFKNLEPLSKNYLL